MLGAREKLKAWTLVDEIVLETFGLTKSPSSDGMEDLAGAMRGAALRSALRTTQAVQARLSDLDPALRSALSSLGELRYLLYLARRLGLFDLRRYRASCARLERAQKAIRDLLAESGADRPACAEASPGNGTEAALLAAFAPLEGEKET